MVHNLSQAQCGSGEVQVQIEISSDFYGSEGYWELVSADSTCGQGTILSGGNSAVGCNGAGAQNQPTGGYASNSTNTSALACLVQGSDYRIAYVDDWGDGGFEFTVYINGYILKNYEGAGSFEYFTFTADEPPAFDLTTILPDFKLYQQPGNMDLEAEIYNRGTDTITSLELNYSINNGTAVTQTISGLSIAHNTSTFITHPTPWAATTNGDYQIKIWHDNLNGSNPDANTADDEVETSISIGPDRLNIIDSYLTTLPVIVEIADGGDRVNIPTDLDFHPILTRNELWVVNKDLESQGSSTVTIKNAGESNQTETWKRDGNAWHFMSLTTGLAFSDNGNFGTSPGVYDANHNGGQAFTGPALWSSDLTVYAEPSGGNGSHLDMLHESPECQGIAHESDNVFWVFDGYNKDIVRYDFADDHGPGNDYHGDGELLRFSEDGVKADSDDEVPSHLEYDKETDWLYVVDYGNARVFKIDTKSGTLGGTPTYGPFETLTEYREVDNYTSEAVVDTGLLEPSGIALMGDFMLISDYGTGDIIIYDRTTSPATQLKRLVLNAEGIMGITIGPDGHIWYVDHEDETVNRLDWMADTVPAVGISEQLIKAEVRVFPNPSNGFMTIQNLENEQMNYSITNYLGQTIATGLVPSGMTNLSIDVAPGVYQASFRNKTHTRSITRNLIVTK